jgi:hypothetical protein
MLCKVYIIFPQSLLHYQRTFSTFVSVPYNSSLRRRSSPHMLFFSSSSSSANGVLGAHPSGGRKDGSRMVLNRGCREDEGEHSTPLSQLPPLCTDLCAVWSCDAGGALDSSSCLAEHSEFVVLTSFNACACRCELTAAPVFRESIRTCDGRKDSKARIVCRSKTVIAGSNPSCGVTYVCVCVCVCVCVSSCFAVILSKVYK